MTYASMDPDAWRTAGIGEGLLRLSVGIEDAADLAADLKGWIERLRLWGASQLPCKLRSGMATAKKDGEMATTTPRPHFGCSIAGVTPSR